ncbi:MarR family winged helix-turn-helix transcriptional regulator [Curtobacterium sp. SP.BCp]|jgi:DNA-binding MarR family transcriptional regulator|uniref:MarR family winged helix-turn-helix transcriptional regulator n=1 Tax=Curtobacterium sp. SP.BCp TaxID=3435230 RepID=UPI003F7377F9
MTDPAPVLPARRADVLPPAPVSPDVVVPAPDADLTRLLTAFRLFQAQHARALDHESVANGLGPTDARFLFHLAAADGEGITPKQAGAHLELSTGAMTSLIDRLERRGHLERRPNPTDRRSILLHLTPSGVAVAETIGARWVDAFRQVVPPGERAALAAVLDEVGSALARRA